MPIVDDAATASGRSTALIAADVPARLRLFSHLANIGDVHSLVIHPASTTHAQIDEAELAAVGLMPSLVRLSVGLEHADGLVADLAQVQVQVQVQVQALTPDSARVQA